MDLSKGLSVCGDSREAYLDILRIYAERPETDRLNACQRNAHDYQTLVHGIKSASPSIGFSQLAALALENAARAEDWELILAGHPAFIDESRLAVGAIQEAFRS